MTVGKSPLMLISLPAMLDIGPIGKARAMSLPGLQHGLLDLWIAQTHLKIGKVRVSFCINVIIGYAATHITLL
jgi:hypothetical protein